MKILSLTGVLVAIWSVGALAQANKAGTYYVKESVLEERLAPSKSAASTNRIYFRQKVEVFEVKQGWARVSKYYDGSVEGENRQVARWVRADGLSLGQPAELAQPQTPRDPRIDKDAIPKVGEGGLTVRDVEILYKGALKFLNSGRCARVSYADKSTSKPNTYYVNCGADNLFFQSGDL